MGFKDFFEKVNNFSNEKKLVEKFDKNLSGVHIYAKSKICDGYRLYDGKLINIEGKIIKKWPYKNLGIIYNGRYIAQKGYETKEWGMFDLDGNLIWSRDDLIHHDISISENKTILTFLKEVKKYRGRLTEFDVIAEFDFKGNLISKYSIYENLSKFQKFHKKLLLDFPKIPFIKKDFAKSKESIWGGNYDYYHANSIQVIPNNKYSKNDKRFQSGNLIISFRHGSMIFILDKNSKEIVYNVIYDQIENNLEGQHMPQMLKNGNLLIFDNGIYRKWSRVIELNPITLKIDFEYKFENFFSKFQGNAQLLPNNNYLITESEKGRIFEITKNKEIVWEFYHFEKKNLKNSRFKESFGKRQCIYRTIFYSKDILNN